MLLFVCDVFGGPGGGFGGPGGGFRTGRSSGKATAGTGAKKTTPRTTKTTTGTSSWAKIDTNYFWTGTLIKCRDYKKSLTIFRKSLEVVTADSFLILPISNCPGGGFGGPGGGCLPNSLSSGFANTFTTT